MYVHACVCACVYLCVCVHMHEYQSTYVKVRGQLARADSLNMWNLGSNSGCEAWLQTPPLTESSLWPFLLFLRQDLIIPQAGLELTMLPLQSSLYFKKICLSEVLFSVLGIESRVFHKLHKCYTTRLCPQALKFFNCTYGSCYVSNGQ